MRVLISFYSKTGRTKKIAEELAKTFESYKHETSLYEITPQEVLKAARYNKEGKDLVLVDPLVDVRQFDLVLVGTPVWSFCPSPIVLSYIRQLKGTKRKNFALFSTCTALPGTTIKRMSNILSTMNANVLDSLMIRGVFEIDAERLALARKFVKKLAFDSSDFR